MTAARGGRDRAAVPLLTVACAVLAGLLLWALPGRGPLGSLLIAGLVALGTILTESRPLHVAYGGERRTFTFAEAPLVAGLVLSPGVAVAVGCWVGIVAVQVARRLPPAKILFNAAQLGASVALAVLAAVRIPSLLGVLLGIAGFSLLNDLLVQLVLRVTAGRPFRHPFADRALPWFLHVGGVVSTSVLIARVTEIDGSLSLAFLAPMALLVHLQRAGVRQHVSTQLLQSVADHALFARSGDRQAMGELLARTARDVLAVPVAEVLLLGELRPSLVSVSDDGPAGVRSVSSDWYSEQSWYRAAYEAGQDGTARGAWAGVVIGPPLRPLALLSLTRAGTEEPFREADLAALRLLSATGARWIGAASEPAPPPRTVIDLVQPRVSDPPTTPSRAGLAAELDRLSAELGDVHAEPAALSEGLAAAQRRLTEIVLGLLSDRRTEDDVISLGTWPAPRPTPRS